MTRAYDRLIAIGKSKGHYTKNIFERTKIEAPTQLKFYKRRLVLVKMRLNYYRPMRLNYLQIRLVGELKMFEDELKRRIAQCTI